MFTVTEGTTSIPLLVVGFTVFVEDVFYTGVAGGSETGGPVLCLPNFVAPITDPSLVAWPDRKRVFTNTFRPSGRNSFI